MGNITAEEFDKILLDSGYSRICANSWVYRSQFCNVYLDVFDLNAIETECSVRFETTGTSQLSISYSKTIKLFDSHTIGQQIVTMCDMLSSVSDRTMKEINNIFIALE